MEIEFDPAKDAAHLARHGVSLASGAAMTIETTRTEDGERRFRAVGTVEGKLRTAVHVVRGTVVRMISVRRSNDGEERAYRTLR